MKYSLKTHYKKLLADTLTPVSIYLKLRDKLQNPILLESSDYHGNENSFSFICLQPLARFEVSDNQILTRMPDESVQKIATSDKSVIEAFIEFSQAFEIEAQPFNFPQNGLFGFTTFDSIQYFEDLEIRPYNNENRQIPAILYQVYQFVIAINHFNNELYIFEHLYGDMPSRLSEVEAFINQKSFPAYPFSRLAEEKSNLNDACYMELVELGKHHCRRGDVFQIVLSRQFEQKFQGDEFNVYRTLRSINPSPYLFYFDYGTFKIFGSSPEAQIVIKQPKAEIHPIAGTFKRTGNDQEDAQLAQKLFADEKETAEHVMLVDLARNDLSRNGNNVKVETFKEIQYYSHLIHLVSKVTAEIDPQKSGFQLFADTFPAGTLSGAPKYKAVQLINQYENQNRGFYGGAIGWMSFQGDINHAIMIRSFLSKNNTLYYQAGAGIVSKSLAHSELEEVNNKLRALRKALKEAEGI
ncbi:MAG: anthranilate synthase component I family protein [Microscillaceae bacterium]|jgi:anthranilate synthase component 1|nr:anthranilate synthase component I family protein [Microscillaceae bacterium]